MSKLPAHVTSWESHQEPHVAAFESGATDPNARYKEQIAARAKAKEPHAGTGKGEERAARITPAMRVAAVKAAKAQALPDPVAEMGKVLRETGDLTKANEAFSAASKARKEAGL